MFVKDIFLPGIMSFGLCVETYFFLRCLGEIVFRWNFVLCACECFTAFAESPAKRDASCLGVISNGRLVFFVCPLDFP